jgi:hypothetical protein
MAEKITTSRGPMWIETCCECQAPFAMSDQAYRYAQDKGPRFNFSCPYGHPQHYTKGESEEEKLRRERDRLKQEQARYEQELAETRDRVASAERRASAARGQVTKLKKRAANGICPCCNRTFVNLQRHMTSQHPGFLAEPDAAAHVH